MNESYKEEEKKEKKISNKVLTFPIPFSLIEIKEFMINQQIFLLIGTLKTGSVDRISEARKDVHLNIFN